MLDDATRLLAERAKRYLLHTAAETEAIRLVAEDKRQQKLARRKAIRQSLGLPPNRTKRRKPLSKRFVRPTYYEHIASKRWQSIKKAAIRYYGGKCSICGSTENLHVHHKSYDTLGRERMRDLQVLCKGCHDNLHEGKVPGIMDPLTREFIAICGER